MRPWVLFAGAVLMLPALASFVAVAWIDAKGKSLREYEPAWMLLNQTRGGSRDSRNDALRLLMDRYTLGAKSGKPMLTPFQIRSMFDCILEHQADPDEKWTSALGNFFEHACAIGDVTNEQWKRYLQQALEGLVTLRVRGKIAPGHFIPIEITTAKPRIGTFYSYEIDIIGPVTLNPTGEELVLGYTCDVEPSSSRWMIAPSLLVGDDFAQKLKPGPQSIEGDVQIVLRQTLPGAAPSRAMVGTRLRGNWEFLPGSRTKPPSTSTTRASK